MKFLIRTTEMYRVANEDEAKQLIEAAKKDRNFTLTKYTSEYKAKKSKGEVVEDWYRVTLTKDFTEEKEPDRTASVQYSVDMGAFPDPVTRDEDEGTEDDDENGGIEF